MTLDGTGAAMRLDLIDGFRLRLPSCEPSLPTTAQRLVALLGLRHALDRSTAAGTLWPDFSESRAVASLRSALWRINSAANALVLSDRHQLRLNPEVVVDVDEVSHLAQRLHRGCDLDEGDRLLHIEAGELLPGWDETWVELERERLRQLQLYALTDLAQLHVTAGDVVGALELVHRALRLEPLRESTHRVLVSIFVRVGDYGAALRSFDGYRRLAATELGVPPSPSMLEVVASIPRLHPPVTPR
jgi:DNA-binding SARP family transcriptional activator